jgi:hypothetical protein
MNPILRVAEKFVSLFVPSITAQACTPGRVVVSQSGGCPGVVTVYSCYRDYFCHYSSCSSDSFAC